MVRDHFQTKFSTIWLATFYKQSVNAKSKCKLSVAFALNRQSPIISDSQR